MLGIDVNGKLNNALNGLNFVKAFYTAYNSSSGLSQEKVSILHMEAFLFLMAHQDHDGIPLLNLQEALGHAQAKMQRIAVALQKVGWINIEKDPQDGRQRIVYLTETALAIFGNVSNCFSNEKNSFTYQTVSEQMKATIAEKTSEREVMMNADNILAGAAINAKASMNVNVKVVGVGAKGAAGNVQTEVSSHPEYKTDEASVMKREAKRQELEAAFNLKTDLRLVLEEGPRSNSGKIEVGAGYLRTDRGIVTFKVLLKRLKELSVTGKIDKKVIDITMEGVVLYLKTASDADYEKMLTPTPKTRRGKLEAEIANAEAEVEVAKSQLHKFIKQFDSEHIFERPHLKALWTKMQEILKNAQQILSLSEAELKVLDERDGLISELRKTARTPEEKIDVEMLIKHHEEMSEYGALDDFEEDGSLLVPDEE